MKNIKFIGMIFIGCAIQQAYAGGPAGTITREVADTTADTVAQNVSRETRAIADEAAKVANTRGFAFHKPNVNQTASVEHINIPEPRTTGGTSRTRIPVPRSVSGHEAYSAPANEPQSPGLTRGQPSSSGSQLAAGALEVQKAPIVHENAPAASPPEQHTPSSEDFHGYEVLEYMEHQQAAPQGILKTAGAPISPKGSPNPANLGAEQVVAASPKPTDAELVQQRKAKQTQDKAAGKQKAIDETTQFKTQLQEETSRHETAINRERDELGLSRYSHVKELEASKATDAEKNAQMKELTKANKEAKKLDTKKSDIQKQITKFGAKKVLTAQEKVKLQELHRQARKIDTDINTGMRQSNNRFINANENRMLKQKAPAKP